MSLHDFYALIDQSLTDPVAAQAALDARYRTRTAILVLDLTDMVHRSTQLGIVPALARARAAHRVVRPALEQHGGQVLKQVADTLFAVFPAPEGALLAALDAHTLLEGLRTVGPDTPIRACIGLGWGECYLIPGEDVFGEDVNRAFVLGEDAARGGEVLMTPAFRAGLQTIPEGVGVHEGNEDRAHQIGVHFFEARDYRD
jgi:adenylate cyclase